MALEVQKKGSEASQSLVRRFIYKVHRAGILLEARKRLFYEKPKNKRAKRLSALRKLQKKTETEKKKKLGEL